MTCKICNEVNVRYLNGSKKLGLSHQYYDMDGKFHNHDSNSETKHFVCSQGHYFSENYQNPCWCGWPNSVEMIDPNTYHSSLSYFPK